MSDFWKNKKVLVTGGNGFIGRAVVEALVQTRGVAAKNIIIPRSSDCDLRTLDNCMRAVQNCRIVIHLAARTGGIAYSRRHPASQYYDCMLMSLNILEASHRAGIEKFVGVGNILVYPAAAPSPLAEPQLHNGRVAGTHLGIGTAKRDLVLLCEMYHQECGLNAVNVLLGNAYGPHDRFDPKFSHVIPATIAKCHEKEKLVVWGDGKPTRDFIYVTDAAEGILLAAEMLNPPDYYVNITTGHEISIAELVRQISRLSDFKGDISFDASKNGGDPRRCASNRKAKELLGFEARVSFEEGLKKTIAWYREHLQPAA